MVLEIREENGVAVFICSRTRSDPHSELATWIGAEAERQERCVICIAPLSHGCGGAGTCPKPPTPDAAAVAILRGMVAG